MISIDQATGDQRKEPFRGLSTFLDRKVSTLKDNYVIMSIKVGFFYTVLCMILIEQSVSFTLFIKL